MTCLLSDVPRVDMSISPEFGCSPATNHNLCYNVKCTVSYIDLIHFNITLTYYTDVITLSCYRGKLLRIGRGPTIGGQIIVSIPRTSFSHAINVVGFSTYDGHSGAWLIPENIGERVLIERDPYRTSQVNNAPGMLYLCHLYLGVQC